MPPAYPAGGTTLFEGLRKVSLNAYEQSVNAADPADREAALKRHVAAIRTHVTTLSDKGYDAMDDASVDYVLMFIPIEGAFSEALRVDPDLADEYVREKLGVMHPAEIAIPMDPAEKPAAPAPKADGQR